MTSGWKSNLNLSENCRRFTMGLYYRIAGTGTLGYTASEDFCVTIEVFSTDWMGADIHTDCKTLLSCSP